MEQLWTPWRMPYIVSNKDVGDCIFCTLPGMTDHHHYILHRGPTTYVIMNLYPYAIGHLMVIPYRHLPRLGSLDDEELAELTLRLRQSERILRRAVDARWFHMGINLERAAGAGVKGHLHGHLVPRGVPAREGSATAEPDAVDEEIEETYEKLRPHFDRLG